MSKLVKNLVILCLLLGCFAFFLYYYLNRTIVEIIILVCILFVTVLLTKIVKGIIGTFIKVGFFVIFVFILIYLYPVYPHSINLVEFFMKRESYMIFELTGSDNYLTLIRNGKRQEYADRQKLNIKEGDILQYSSSHRSDSIIQLHFRDGSEIYMTPQSSIEIYSLPTVREYANGERFIATLLSGELGIYTTSAAGWGIYVEGQSFQPLQNLNVLKINYDSTNLKITINEDTDQRLITEIGKGKQINTVTNDPAEVEVITGNISSSINTPYPYSVPGRDRIAEHGRIFEHTEVLDEISYHKALILSRYMSNNSLVNHQIYRHIRFDKSFSMGVGFAKNPLSLIIKNTIQE